VSSGDKLNRHCPNPPPTTPKTSDHQKTKKKKPHSDSRYPHELTQFIRLRTPNFPKLFIPTTRHKPSNLSASSSVTARFLTRLITRAHPNLSSLTHIFSLSRSHDIPGSSTPARLYSDSLFHPSVPLLETGKSIGKWRMIDRIEAQSRPQSSNVPEHQFLPSILDDSFI
jgi:hypothetical protein